MLKCNLYAAQMTGGKFILRFDDDQLAWIQLLGRERIAENCRKIIDELTWLGIQPDYYCWQSTRSDGFRERIQAVMPGLIEDASKYAVPILVRDDAPQYPDAQYLIASTVLHDWQDGVTQLILGDELLGRFAAYRLWATMLDVPQIATPIHLPRLRAGGELASVSKTEGNHRIESYRRKGYTPADIETMLRQACLVDPSLGWDWRNVKQQPQLQVMEASWV